MRVRAPAHRPSEQRDWEAYARRATDHAFGPSGGPELKRLERVRENLFRLEGQGGLRRKGPTPDVIWEKSVVLARRSQTRGDEVREATKNATRFRVTLPTDVIAVLRWHADRLPSGAMRDSDLLFPSETGDFRSPTVLDKPFKDVCQHLALEKKVTARAMRRTFQDLARRASIDGLIQRSICGHLNEEMTER